MDRTSACSKGMRRAKVPIAHNTAISLDFCAFSECTALSEAARMYGFRANERTGSERGSTPTSRN